MATQINYLDQEYIITKPMQIDDGELNNFLVHIIQNSEHRVDLHKHGLKWSFFSAKMFDDSAPLGSVVLGLYIGDSTLSCSKIEEIINGVAVAEASFAAVAKTPIDDSSTATKPLEDATEEELLSALRKKSGLGSQLCLAFVQKADSLTVIDELSKMPASLQGDREVMVDTSTYMESECETSVTPLIEKMLDHHQVGYILFHS